MKKDKKEDKKGGDSVNAAQQEGLFAFTCMSDLVAAADALQILKSKRGAIAVSRASRHFCPDKSKFTNYCVLENCYVTTANEHTFRALGMGDVQITFPNGTNYSTVIFKDSVYAPDLTSTLIFISRLDIMKCGTLFKDDKCTISYPNGKPMAILPLSKGLYQLAAEKSGSTSDHA